MKLPFRRRRSLVDRLRDQLSDWRDDSDDLAEESTFGGLHLMTAGLFIAAGAEAALGERRGDHRAPDTVRWAPLVTAPLAGAAHAAQAVWPGSTTRALTQVANGLAIGVGAAGLAASVYALMSGADHTEDAPRTLPSLAPLAFCAVGLLGLVLDEQEEDVEEEHAELEKRARVVERLVPKRRARVDHIVVHV